MSALKILPLYFCFNDKHHWKIFSAKGRVKFSPRSFSLYNMFSCSNAGCSCVPQKTPNVYCSVTLSFSMNWPRYILWSKQLHYMCCMRPFNIEKDSWMQLSNLTSLGCSSSNKYFNLPFIVINSVSVLKMTLKEKSEGQSTQKTKAWQLLLFWQKTVSEGPLLKQHKKEEPRPKSYQYLLNKCSKVFPLIFEHVEIWGKCMYWGQGSWRADFKNKIS